MGMAVRKTACPKCGASHANQVYNEDGQYNSWCFSCHTYFKGTEEVMEKEQIRYKGLSKEEVSTFPIRQESDRKILPEINERFGVRVSINEMNGLVDTVYYPYHIKGQLTGYKVRILPKDFSKAVGSIKGADLFGKHLCGSRRKAIIIAEGEEDALAVCQVLYKTFGKFPDVVSLVNGAGLGKFTQEAKFLNSYEKIYACFDNDEAGQECLNALAEKVDQEKLYVMELPEKDASECLQSDMPDAVFMAFNNAKLFKPRGVFNAFERAASFLSQKDPEIILYPDEWHRFNGMTNGLRLGDLDIFTASSGTGKTQLCREITYRLLQKAPYNLSLISLEETAKKTIKGILSVHLSERLHLNNTSLTDQDINKHAKAANLDKLWLFDSSENINIFITIKNLIKVNGCKLILIDHLGMILPFIETSRSENDKTGDVIAKLKRMAVQYNVWIGLVVHLKKSSGSISFDKGGVPGVEDIKGASSQYQLADGVYSLQRNKFHSDEYMRNITCLHVLKNRHEGSVGETDYFHFDKSSGRLKIVQKPKKAIIEKQNSEEDF